MHRIMFFWLASQRQATEAEVAIGSNTLELTKHLVDSFVSRLVDEMVGKATKWWQLHPDPHITTFQNTEHVPCQPGHIKHWHATDEDQVNLVPKGTNKNDGVSTDKPELAKQVVQLLDKLDKVEKRMEVIPKLQRQKQKQLEQRVHVLQQHVLVRKQELDAEALEVEALEQQKQAAAASELLGAKAELAEVQQRIAALEQRLLSAAANMGTQYTPHVAPRIDVLSKPSPSSSRRRTRQAGIAEKEHLIQTELHPAVMLIKHQTLLKRHVVASELMKDAAAAIAIAKTYEEHVAANEEWEAAKNMAVETQQQQAMRHVDLSAEYDIPCS
eukprot:gnl/MRDRNA2_/MRDRNA2_78536_c0_seq1.p1 gnl/MRDRNA2_/MRDRNA2_78536_c0~~gnl/MRDRNA2_/MRDRNA2_78536_c0_seq1.p1  ORF type:complete len:328 (+),score=70.86 gnl/MRDRNA2_/MRDRNA2_78536_c0_seq1:158-1141(+)